MQSEACTYTETPPIKPIVLRAYGVTDKGHVKDPGHPLERTGKLMAGKARSVTDGPFAEAKDVVGGYTLVQATDLAQATALASGCPIFELADGTVEVRPVMKMG